MSSVDSPSHHYDIQSYNIQDQYRGIRRDNGLIPVEGELVNAGVLPKFHLWDIQLKGEVITH